jgi:hypothetical protein
MLLNPGFFGRHVETREAFEAAHREFLIYEDVPGPPSWLLRDYLDRGALVEPISSGADRWYRVKLAN